ncbi:MAG: L,D-transpeptidase [Chitinophagales bacterium]|nr:L,D-transpeptidase [Chitinophagales bacterium]
MMTLLWVSCKNNSTKAEIANEAPLAEKVEDTKDEPQPVESHPEIHYQIIHKPDWSGKEDTTFEGLQHLDILIAINRTDSTYLKRLDSVVVPDRYDLDLDAYMPFPKEIALLKDISKIIIFSNPFQAFGAYENGKLVLQGQTNSGRQTHPTPPKLYFTNWKARQSRSTVDRSWILNWNFNISNYEGIGFHQYGLPGYPASHSCLRLLNHHAYFLYNWANQWILKNDQLAAKGTPVIVYGKYRFDQPAPWHDLIQNPQSMIYTQDSMNHIIQPYLEEILEAQMQRQEYLKTLEVSPNL